MSPENYTPLIIGISSRALFDMREERDRFRKLSAEAYHAYQKRYLKKPLKPGTVFQLVQKLMTLNEPGKKPRVEFVLITKNDAATGHRVYESIRHYGLDITRAVMSKGEFEPDVLKAYHIDLFLSRNHDNVVTALKAGIPAAQVYDPPSGYNNKKKGVHFAFDGDKVLFSGLTDNIFNRYGIEATLHHERANAEKPMDDGPFTGLLRKLNALKQSYPAHKCPIKTSLVTMRAEIRPLNTLGSWDQYVDTLYLMGRVDSLNAHLEKAPLLKAIGADIFFDDSRRHTDLSANILPTGYVPDVQSARVPSLSEIMNMSATKAKKGSSRKIPYNSQKPPRP